MPTDWIERTFQPELTTPAKHLRLFPVWLLLGPRQVGKSSLLHKCASDHAYVNLDDLTTRARANQDPALFVRELRPPFTVDEIQYAPRLLSLELTHFRGHLQTEQRRCSQWRSVRVAASSRYILSRYTSPVGHSSRYDPSCPLPVTESWGRTLLRSARHRAGNPKKSYRAALQEQVPSRRPGCSTTPSCRNR